MSLLPLTNPSLFLLFFPYLFSIPLLRLKEAEPKKSMPLETNLAEQSEQPQKANDAESAAQPNSEVSEVEIPSVGRILVRSDADGYDEEVQRLVQGLAVYYQSYIPFSCSSIYFKVFGNN